MASTVDINPSVLILSRTIRTLSGCCRALSIQFAFPKFTNIRSVLAEIRLARVRISSSPVLARGGGTSRISVLPVLKFCRTCFMRHKSRERGAHVGGSGYAEICEKSGGDFLCG